MMKNKKAVAPIIAIGIALAVILVVYLFLFIPIPAFAKLRQGINYYLIIAIWIIIQIAVVYSVYKIVMYVKQAVKLYKKKLLNFDLKIKELILTH